MCTTMYPYDDLKTTSRTHLCFIKGLDTVLNKDKKDRKKQHHHCSLTLQF
jgi:hypothetical protein